MSSRFLSLALLTFIGVSLFNWSCTKLDTTTIGSDLIPEVDNIHTFADTLEINTLQGIFNDSTKLSLTDNYVYGKTTDPLLGGTNARLFLQFKPGFYPYYFGSPLDTITAFDSVVLCLSYKGAYGDTLNAMTPIELQVNEVASTVHGEWDSLGTFRDINYAPVIGNALSAPVNIDLPTVKSYRKIGKGKDSVINQVRIKLSDAFRDAIFSLDSVRATNGAFSRDSLFRAFNNGFAVTMTGGNALLYTQLSDPYTRLELHYKRKNGAVSDTSMSTFAFNNGSGGSAAPSRSAVADNIVRTRNAIPFGDQELYIQTAPGTYATLQIPRLTGYTNRIVHRAEIIMEQIPDNPVTDASFNEPDYLYLDLVDSGTTNKWKPIYFDLNPSLAYDPDYKAGVGGLPYFPGTGEVDISYFGGNAKKKQDGSGTRVYYTINVTRYLQQLVTKQTPNYEMRLYAPHNLIYPQYAPTVIPYINTIAKGRIKLAGGSYVDPDRRMRMRIIYSKID